MDKIGLCDMLRYGLLRARSFGEDYELSRYVALWHATLTWGCYGAVAIYLFYYIRFVRFGALCPVGAILDRLGAGGRHISSWMWSNIQPVP